MACSKPEKIHQFQYIDLLRQCIICGSLVSNVFMDLYIESCLILSKKPFLPYLAVGQY